MQGVDGDDGQGAGTSNVGFDHAKRRNSAKPDPTQPAPDPSFRGGSLLMRQAEGKQMESTHGVRPRVAALTGTLSGLGPITSVRYNHYANLFIVNESVGYFAPVAPRSVADLFRAIARKDNIAVTIGTEYKATDSLRPDSKVVLDLMLADRFLAE